MKDNFQKALTFTLRWEGGYVNDPDDRGGATNKGITQGTYNSFRRQKGQEVQAVSRITDAEVCDIYRTLYWDKIGGDGLSSGLDIAAFDFAVNSGPGRVLSFLLARPGATADDLVDYRERFLRNIGVGRQSKFLNGWLNRIRSLREYLHGLN